MCGGVGGGTVGGVVVRWEELSTTAAATAATAAIAAGAATAATAATAESIRRQLLEKPSEPTGDGSFHAAVCRPAHHDEVREEVRSVSHVSRGDRLELGECLALLLGVPFVLGLSGVRVRYCPHFFDGTS